MVISRSYKRKPKKLGLKQERKVIQLFNNLFRAGFHLTEIIDFLERSHLLPDQAVQTMAKGLASGGQLADVLRELRFSDTVVTQLSLAHIHGNVQGSLARIEIYLTSLAQVRKKLIEVATYPLILLSFLVLIMLGLKQYLLPQVSEAGNFAGQLIRLFPTLFFMTILLGSLIAFGLVFWVKKSERLSVLTRAVRLPLLGRFIRLYFSAYFAREWGNLIGQGLEMTQIVHIMQEQPSPLFVELGRDMEKGMLLGRSFSQQVATYPFFTSELSVMIAYGEMKSKVASELDIYAQETWETFFEGLHRATQVIQPLVFILVALVIVMIYAAMLLPMYQNMEVPF
ncbi:competence type IV pilus assembly protein ComGB [Streptococcus sp. DD12]|uniref:competence type IV pilus assembly protein ComGB n=1 Tax=Streptococcus sp. DD12 TaxID=1777880 RepID=UPI0007946ED0|nr:competence type IV pilus assembly protein ComGB [Streptococcus sp. DD12]KXT75384.1 Late competence protein ComGB, access of DNA to ComEA [Streptococcus sp. DD12]